ncbi:hypothetical protein EV193_1205 [Herbihabitans rhizosphaerae]|uniref:Uncharacterized protein n=1 Tax=Herbihabitans rhizosphaerae TaxID=1872711 RepID=A0A4Q7KE83_9PSEU|nr:hypothetical protein EV193_1205 [Herbihabitans rhizosphaerae]
MDVQHEPETPDMIARPVPGPPPSPTAAIDAALERLDGLDDVPLPEHVARFDAAHVALTDALSSIDKG